MLQEAKELRLSDNAADVVLYLEPAEFQFKFLNLVLENLGPGIASDVLARCVNYTELPDQGSRGIKLDTVFFLKDKIPLMVPRQKFTTFVYSAVTGIASEKGLEPLICDLQYKDGNNKFYQKRVEVDLRIIEGSRRVGSQSPLHDIERHMGNLSRILEESTRGSRKMKVDVYNSQDRREEEEFLKQYYAQAEEEKPE